MPQYTVVIYEHGSRTYQVEAPSLPHVKEMYLRDEDELGKPIDSRIFSSAMEVRDETGATHQEAAIEELRHKGDQNLDPLCGEEAGDEWQTTDDWGSVNCPMCVARREDPDSADRCLCGELKPCDCPAAPEAQNAD